MTQTTGITNGLKFIKSKQGEQVNSQEKQKQKKQERSELKRIFSKAERLAFLDRERAELPEELRKPDHVLSDADVKEIRELGKEKQAKGFWANYAKAHGVSETYLYRVRRGYSSGKKVL